MTAKPISLVHTAVDAALDLERVQAQVAAARAVLIRLLQDVVEAEARLGSTQGAQLLEANEQLVVAAMRSQAEADTASASLEAASRAAEFDDLTQLPNRVLMLDRLATAIANARRHGGRMALLFLDLDNFKPVNDGWGHPVGDTVLQHVARCLVGAVRKSDTVSRHGGDEFLILLSEVSQPRDAALIAEKVHAALALPIDGADAVPRLSASIGISVYPEDGGSPEALIASADAAMYDAKRSGPGRYAFHSPAAAPGMAPLPAAARHRDPPAAPDPLVGDLRDANEQLVLAVLSARDLQVAAEQAQRRQVEFIAAMAEELRSPLAPIRIAAAMLGRASADERLLPRAQAIIERQLANMTRLLGAVNDVAQASAAALGPDPREYDAGAVAAAAADAWRPAMDARRQRFTVRLPGQVCPTRGDPTHLTQIVGNLLDNASRYTQEGGAIEMSLEARGEELVLTVSDDGIGIDARALPTLFEPFGQTLNAVGLNNAGAGIGLTVVRALAAAHGGGAVASSAGIGRGSQFVVTLPLASVLQVPAAAPGLDPAS